MSRSSVGVNVERVRELRLALPLDQAEFAAMVGVTRKHMNRIEVGKTNVSAQTLRAMAKVLEVAPKEIIAPAAVKT